MATGVTGAAALLVTGCSDGGPEAAGPESAGRAERLRRDAARHSAELLGRYDRTLAAHPSLAGRLEPLRADVARHVEAFGGTGRKDASGAPDASAAPSASPERETGREGRGAPVPEDTDRALTTLANAERATAAALTRALDGAPPELARLLASVAAAGAAHAYLLTNGGER
nr:hypothetical protein [Streptomyces taklimakanensis]